jgi:hypothetical protein
MAAGCGTTDAVRTRAAGVEPATGWTRQCIGVGGRYIVHYPASWFTVDYGPAPCQFFHPKPFTLPESTEVPGIAIHVQLAPAPFDTIVPPVERAGGFEETLGRLRGARTGHQTARVESRSRVAGILPAGTRRLTWYVEAGQETLVATTTASASAGLFAANAEVLDRIVAAVTIRPALVPTPELTDVMRRRPFSSGMPRLGSPR